MDRELFGVDVAKLRERRIVLDVSAPPGALDLEIEDFTFHGDLTGRLTYLMAGGDIFVHGKLRAQAEGQCVRCLGPAQCDLEVEVGLAFTPGASDSEPEQDEEGDSAVIDHYSGDYFDPSGQLRELVLLELPPLPLCDPECPGLCPGCGANLNEEACQCSHASEEREAEPAAEADPWKALRGLKLKD